MKKLIIIGGIFGIILAGLLIYYFIFRTPPTTETDPQEVVYNIPAIPNVQVPDSDTLELVVGSEKITVNNFYKTAQKIIENSVYIKDLQNYSIIYFADKNNFLISLNSYTGSEAKINRPLAEQELLTALGIGPDTACKLNISEKIPISYNADLSTLEFGFSYCEGATQIPGSDESTSSGIR